MEESLWLYFGVVAALIGLVIVAQLVTVNIDREKGLAMDSSLNQLANFCDFICVSDVNQLLSQTVSMSSGSKLYSTDLNGLCYNFQEKQKCRPCKCGIYEAENYDPQSPQNFELDLNKQEIINLYQKHDFSCTFFRAKEGVTLACKG